MASELSNSDNAQTKRKDSRTSLPETVTARKKGLPRQSGDANDNVQVFFSWISVLVSVVTISKLPLLQNLPLSESNFRRDAIFAMGCMMSIATLRYVVSSIMERVGMRFMLSDTYQGRERTNRALRFGNVSSKILYFLVATVWGYWALRDAEWFPPVLGGRGQIELSWRNYDPEFVHSRPLKLYYLLGLSYHSTNTLYDIFIRPNRADFGEICLHHVLTLVLVTVSLKDNALAHGSMVYFVHDATDIFTYSSKMLADTPYQIPATVSFISLLIMWAYMRLYVFPFHILRVLFTEERSNRMAAPFFVKSILSCLYVLNIYWFYLIASIAYKFATKGVLRDDREKEGGENNTGKKTT